jgi:virginiamycin B lyase
MRHSTKYLTGLASAAFLAASLLLQGCGQGRGFAPAAPQAGTQAVVPDASQTPLIGPTAPPHGNFMVEYPVPTALAGPRRIKHCGLKLCMTEFDASNVDVVNQRGSFVEYPTPTSGSGPVGISQGSDKNFWFTESNANQIGRLTPTGQISEFPIPTAGSQPTAIWNGSKLTRLMWFTESAANQIASINVDTGSVVEYPIPTPNSDPESITLDGRMWFVERAANKVGSISSTGVISEINIPTNDSGADDITPVQDGNVWITEPNVGKIARVDVRTGVITEFVVPYANSQPTDITEGDIENHGSDLHGDPFPERDDQVWFTDAGVNAMSGYNYRTGVFNTPISIPTIGSGAGGVSYGGDNNIWFVEQTADKVGVYHLPTPPPTITSRTP